VPKFEWPRPILRELLGWRVNLPPTASEQVRRAVESGTATAEPKTAALKNTNHARAELLYKAALPQTGAMAWSTEQALAEARRRFPGNPLLNSKSIRSFRTAWRLARRLLHEQGET
jgi:hypothetical protein